MKTLTYSVVLSYSISVTENPEKNAAESKAGADASADPAKNDAAGDKSPGVTPPPAPGTGENEALLIVDELDTDEIEALVNESHPPIRAPKIKELLESPDPPSRFITYLAFAFALLALACVGTLVSKYLEARRARQPVVVETAPAAPEKIFTESLGEFRLVLKGAESPNDGELRVDMVAECSTEAACLYLKDHLVQARDIVIPVLVNLRREELLDPGSKNLIRRRIAEQLNSLPMNGKIIQILFTDLTIEDASEGS